MSTPELEPTSLMPRWQGAVAGLVAGAAALSTGELVASFAAPRPGPVAAVANRVIDHAPTWFVEFGKEVFGFSDKVALGIGTVLIALVVAAALGVASRKHALPGIVGIVGFGLVGLVAIAADAQAGVGSAFIFSALSVMAGLITLGLLLGLGRSHAVAQSVAEVESPTGPAPIGRRGFLGWAGAMTGAAALAALGARQIRGRSVAAEARDAVQITNPTGSGEIESAVAGVNAGPIAQTPGITPVVVPNKDFYRIDTAFLVPQVNPDDWKLTIKGLVDQEVTYTYQELLDRAQTVEMVTLSCVSNPVGGDLVGNAIWQGVPLSELLDEARVQDGATQISSRSVDGWTCGFPTEAAFDGRTALVAVAMNGEPLPIEHGFPVRLVVSGLYGYVSATKWLESIELTTMEAFDGYWIPRGWSKSGPVKTQSRIDTPSNRSSLTSGTPIPIAGVAWAPNTGIDKVEVNITSAAGETGWQEAELSESLGANAWRQWRFEWTPDSGTYNLQVRATDASGYTQTPEQVPVAPNGATGWHTVQITA